MNLEFLAEDWWSKFNKSLFSNKIYLKKNYKYQKIGLILLWV